MTRKEIVAALEELARLSDLLGENPFKGRTYARAARTLARTQVPESSWTAPGTLESLKGIGKAVSAKVREMAATGRMRKLDELRNRVPEGVRELFAVPGLGTKKIRVLWQDLGVGSLAELECACLENRLAALPGLDARSQERVLEGVRFALRHADMVLAPATLSASQASQRRKEP